MLIPSMGVLLGDHGRIIVGKKSVIWKASTNYFLDNLCGGYILPHFLFKFFGLKCKLKSDFSCILS
jgi:hypothetical protein